MVVLAARNSDVDALNLAAQQIRRVAGELGAEHTYVLPGGDALTLAVGDVVRVRQNDYRSRRGEGPDILNGYRAVITAIDADQNVQISWRAYGRTSKQTRYESVWVKTEKVISEALSLGYAMTISASQGLTCDTSLMYGLGANAFATYPGITRARRQNHLWLPLAALRTSRLANNSAKRVARRSSCSVRSAPSPGSLASRGRMAWFRTSCASHRPRRCCARGVRRPTVPAPTSNARFEEPVRQHRPLPRQHSNSARTTNSCWLA